MFIIYVDDIVIKGKEGIVHLKQYFAHQFQKKKDLGQI